MGAGGVDALEIVTECGLAETELEINRILLNFFDFARQKDIMGRHEGERASGLSRASERGMGGRGHAEQREVGQRSPQI